MQPTLTQEQLESLLSLLKDALEDFEARCHHKIAFFNDWCMYRHIREYKLPALHREVANIGTLLDVLEPYIPFKLTEENFELFMESVFLPHEPGPSFSHKAKMDFVIALRAIRSQVQWRQALSVCEAIRAIKEELETSQV